jgi:hypothetical protein
LKAVKACRPDNATRPHGSLGLLSPIEFEAAVQQLPPQSRPELEVWPTQPLRKLSKDVDLPHKL